MHGSTAMVKPTEHPVEEAVGEARGDIRIRNPEHRGRVAVDEHGVGPDENQGRYIACSRLL